MLDVVGESYSNKLMKLVELMEFRIDWKFGEKCSLLDFRTFQQDFSCYRINLFNLYVYQI